MTKNETRIETPLEGDGNYDFQGLVTALDYLAQQSKKLGLYFGAHLINVASEGVKMEVRESKRKQ